MSYEKAMKHARNPRKQKARYMGFSPGSGFWPSGSYLKENYWPYLKQCKQKDIEPVSCEAYYKSLLRH